ncbi:hypothetical protein ASZ85_03107 [Vibrio cholerae]|nr:hypothetical protein ASZ85_03107 [Vibrio cholerae]
MQLLCLSLVLCVASPLGGRYELFCFDISIRNPYRSFEATAEMNPMIQDQIPIVFTHIKIPIVRGISCER